MRTQGILLVLAMIGCTGPTVEIVPSADPTTISKIDRGVLFVDAPWSVPSLKARGALQERIENMPIELVIADIDRSEALRSLPALEDKLHGSGESIWVRQGKICMVCTHAECVEKALQTVFPNNPVEYLRSSC